MKLKGILNASPHIKGVLSASPHIEGNLNIYTLEIGDGRDIELARIDDYIVWRRVGDSNWNPLVNISELRPVKGVDYWTEEEEAELLQRLLDTIAASPGIFPIPGIEVIEEQLAQKVDKVDNIQAGSLLEVTDEGNLKCSGVCAEDLVTKKAMEQELENLKFETDNTLHYVNGKLSVNTTNKAESDNTLPITSAAVDSIVGNIEILLGTI